MIRDETDLASLALALIGSDQALYAKEKKLARIAKRPSKKKIEETRKAIKMGLDPLGDYFCALRSIEQRRENGATYTPYTIVDSIVSWARDVCNAPVRVVDPGCGSGRFLMRAATAFPKATLIGVDIDPLATLLLRANAAVLGFAGRLQIKLKDYRELKLPCRNGRTLFIGNPPYVRHHNISEGWKSWFADTAKGYGFKASKLAGLHIHFFLKTRQLSKHGDLGAFITAAEWVDVNYGSVMREMLANGLGGVALHIIDPKAQPFPDAMTTGAITCFHTGCRPDAFKIRSVDTISGLAPLTAGRLVPWSDVERSPKWTALLKPPKTSTAGMMELGELFRVHRGQVTGGNAVWVAGDFAKSLPERFLIPAITRARELFEAGPILVKSEHLRRVIDLPVDLTTIDPSEKHLVDKFLAWAKENGADRSYVARHRKAWWSVGYRDPAPVLVTYMGRKMPHFTRNAAKARHINIAHGLYPLGHLSTGTLDLIIQYLNSSITGENGRVYAGGLVKFEPKELERLLIPRLENLHGFTNTTKVDDCTDSRGRRESDERLSA